MPHLKLFNNLLEIDEIDFVRKTQGTFKLGIQFNDWGKLGDSYIHGFGDIGHSLGLLPFHQYWIKAAQQGRAQDIGTYSINTLAAPRGKFMASANDVSPNSPLANIAYAYHFDSGRYAAYLRDYAEKRGVSSYRGQDRPHPPAPTTVLSNRWCWKAERSSKATCSSTAPVSAVC